MACSCRPALSASSAGLTKARPMMRRCLGHPPN
jgi:hypothetical protein